MPVFPWSRGPSGPLNHRLPRPRTPVRRGLLAIVGVALTVGLLPQYAPDAAAAPGRGKPPALPGETADPVDGRYAQARKPAPDPAERLKVTAPGKVGWPAAGTRQVRLGDQAVRAGGLPLRLGPPERRSTATRTAEAPAKVSVRVADRRATEAAGVDGVLIGLSRGDGIRRTATTRLELDYTGFADAYGASYGARLRLVSYPSCVLTTPGRTGCAVPTPLASRNDTAKGTLSAEVPVAGAGTAATVVAATAAASGDQGDFGATSLSASAEWSVSNASGAFSWSYPVRTPPVPGGLAPSVALGYSSQSVDGQTATTNSQGSWIGQGFGYEPGFIERRYKPCADDGHPKTNGDLCWAHDNATIQLAGGSAGELIRDDTTGEWRLAGDANSRIERKTGASNGDDNGERWVLTTTDGTQYHFGLNRLTGWTTGKEETQSTWTVPVYGDDAGEPCHKATLATSHCLQAWRWNLDYVVDVHGNTMSYYYGKETNHYTQGLLTAENGKPYTRGGYLERIEYGQRDGSAYTTPAPARVVFATSERCIGAAADCEPADLTDTTATRWPDVPWDLNCKAGTKCQGQNSATFWTRKKLDKITTQVRAGAGWEAVDSWSLGHLFTDNGDSSRSLWLNTIKHTGHAGTGTVELPTVELSGTQLPNRVDKPNDNIQPMNRLRLSGVVNESGGTLSVLYRAADCSATSLPPVDAPDRACYPVKWHPPGAVDPVTDWFHKYLAQNVTEGDLTGQAPDMVSEYSYLGDAGWKKARADGITKDEYRTHSDWRGYGKVRVTKSGGTVSAANQRTEHTFLRGLGTAVTDSMGTSHPDPEPLSGHELETTVYNGGYTADKIVSKSVATAWHRATATRAETWGTRHAYYVRSAATTTHTALEGGGWQETKAVNRYDNATGRLVEVDDYGQTGDASDNKCVRTEYADSAAKHIYDLVSRVETVAVGCSATPDRATQVVSDNLSFYDGLALGATPVRGLPTKVQRLKSHNGTTPVYQTVSQSAVADFDTYGRPVKTTDIAGNSTLTDYTETDGLTTKKTETNPLGWKTVTDYDRTRGVPSAQTDMNGRRTDLAHDALGRLTSVWLPDRDKATRTPSIKYTYQVAKNAPVAVRTQKYEADRNGVPAYGTEYTLYDGLLRPRQTQTEGPGGGSFVADTFYDGLGNVVATNNDYTIAAAPSAQLFTPTSEVDGHSSTVYDGAGRPTAEIFKVANVEKWRTTYAYGGDRVHRDPPAGAAPTTTITDARGRTEEIRRYKGDAPLPTGTPADYEATHYTYTAADLLKTVRDPGGNVWSYGYDQRGRKTSATDPDTGTSTTAYDDFDRPTSATDARNKKISTTYDAIGRATGTWEGEPTTGTRLTASTYDTVAKGQLYGTYRYKNGVSTAATLQLQLDTMYQPLLTRVVVGGDTAAELKGSYDFSTEYNPDGTVQSQTVPAAGGLPSETLTYDYDELRRPTAMRTALGGTLSGSYVSEATYTSRSLPRGLTLGTLGATGKFASLLFDYEKGTDRLIKTRVAVESPVGTSGEVQDTGYTYDPAGNITSVSDTPAAADTEVQCFGYDWERRLTQAWTSAGPSNGAVGTGARNGACVTPVTAAGVGGPAPYWHSFGYDASDNRSRQTLHGLAGKPDITRTHTYGKDAAGNGGPHTLLRMEQHTPAHGGEPAVTRQDSYTYNQAGQTETRVLNGTTQDLHWNAEGRLSGADTTTRHVDDAGGSRLLKEETGRHTLYLPGVELALNTATRAVEATRYYSFGGRTIALRTAAGVQFLAGDHQGTMSLAIASATASVTRRRMDPFGNPRGTASGPWVDDKGFLGKPADATGLTHIGAREYEPENGRFISADPLIDFSDPQQINGYGYANNSPITLSDPTGLAPDDCGQRGMNCWKKPGGGWAQEPNEEWDRSRKYRQIYTPPAKVKAIQARNTAKKTETRMKTAAQELAGIVADELGITDALDCFTTGSLGSCGATAMNLLAPTGIIAKLALKYGAPWRWSKGAALVKKIGKLAESLLSDFLAWQKQDRKASRLEEAAESCENNSFTPETRVLMADGSTKAIEDVDVGDVVLATDPETGETSARTVTAEITGKGTKNLVRITIDTDGSEGDATSTVTATDGHPFWVPELREWIDATDLRRGQLLRTSAGTHIQITGISRATEPDRRVHNLTVADVHTYYVLAGTTPVLTHNCPSDGFLSRLFGKGSKAAEAVHEPNATVGDLRGIGHDNVDGSGNWRSDPLKAGMARSMTDDQLLKSTTQPTDGEFSLLRYHAEDGYMIEGNHRMAELLSRADNPNSRITADTPIYIHLWPGSG